LLFCLFSLGTYTTCDAKISLWDYYASTEEWQFVSNFCYAKQGGKLIVEVLPTNLDTDAMVTFYPDMKTMKIQVVNIRSIKLVTVHELLPSLICLINV